MTENDVTNWILVDYTATLLYSVIADGNYRKTNVGRAGWKSLVNSARLQPNCNKEGFNVRCGSNRKSRIGILADNKNNCKSCDTVIGFGIRMKNWRRSCGSIHSGQRDARLTFGYIFVQ